MIAPSTTLAMLTKLCIVGIVTLATHDHGAQREVSVRQFVRLSLNSTGPFAA